MAFTTGDEGFPAVAPNGFDLPYAVRRSGWELAGGVALNGLGVAVGLAVAFVLFHRGPSAASPIGLVGVAAAVVFGWSLWRLRLPCVVFHEDRLETPAFFGTRSLFRRDILGVGRNISSRYGSYFLIYPKAGMGAPVQLKARLRDDRVVGPWLAGATDPQARAVEADRAAVLADPRYGATETERAARLDIAKKAMMAFNIACLGGAAWLGFLGALDPAMVGVAIAVLVVGAAVVAASNGLVVWVATWKARPGAVGALAPVAALCLRAFLTVDVLDARPLIWTAALAGVAAVGVLLARPIAALGARGAAVGSAVFVGLATYCAGVLADVAFDTAPARVFPTIVRDKHVSHGRSTSYHLSLAPFAGRPDEDVSVSSERYDRTGVGGLVCAAIHPGALRVGWLEIKDCPAGARAPEAATDAASYYPEEARRRRIEGLAVVECAVTDAGATTGCQAVSETPPGYGFGPAAVSRAAQVRVGLDPARPDPGRRIRIPVRFRIAG